MENDLKGNENYFELTGGSSYRGFESPGVGCIRISWVEVCGEPPHIKLCWVALPPTPFPREYRPCNYASAGYACLGRMSNNSAWNFAWMNWHIVTFFRSIRSFSNNMNFLLKYLWGLKSGPQSGRSLRRGNMTPPFWVSFSIVSTPFSTIGI